MVPADTLQRPEGASYTYFKDLKGKMGQELPDAIIEDVDVETREIEVEPGKVLKGVNCLVIRATYPAGHPMWLEPELNIKGREHRFYSQANKYVGVFWPVTLGDVQSHLRKLYVISVDRFKADAGSRARFESKNPDQDGPPTPVSATLRQKR